MIDYCVNHDKAHVVYDNARGQACPICAHIAELEKERDDMESERDAAIERAEAAEAAKEAP